MAVVIATVGPSADGRQFQSAQRLADWRGTYSQDSHSVCVGDVNADGHADILLLCDALAVDVTEAQLWLGGPGGPLGPTMVPGLPRIRTITTTATVNSAAPLTALADLNADGAADLAVITPTDMQVWLSNANGTFTFAQSFTGSFLEVQVRDVTRDGKPDVLLCENLRLRVLRNVKGALEDFGAYPLSSAHAQPMLFGRIGNGPGPDISILDQIFFNNGAGVFSTTGSWNQNSPILLLDLNGDGKAEPLNTGAINTPSPYNTILPWWIAGWYPFASLNTYNPTTGRRLNFPTPFNGPFRFFELPAGNPFAADFLMYGVQTLLTAGDAESTQITLGKRVGGTLQFDRTVASGGFGIRCVHAADVTGDGCLDLVTVNNGTFVTLTVASQIDRTFGTGLTLIRGDCTQSPPLFRAPAVAGEGSVFSEILNFGYCVLGDIDGDRLPDMVLNRGSFPTAFNGAGTNGGTGRTLVFRNLGGRFDFTRPVHMIGSDTTPFNLVGRTFDFNNDGIDEMYCSIPGGIGRFVPTPISNAPLALPQYWDQAFALSSTIEPVYLYPLPTSNYSSGGGGGSSRAPLDNLMRFDADLDGSLDYVVYENFRDANSGAGGLSRIVARRDDGSEIRSESPVRMSAVAQMDFDRDGDTDIVGIEWPARLTSGEPTCGCYNWIPTSTCDCGSPTRLMVLSNDGDGRFTTIDPGVPFPAVPTWISYRSSLIARDVTGDRIPDLIAVHPPLAAIMVYPGTSGGVASTPISSSTGTGVQAAGFVTKLNAIHDVDRDGDLDFVFVMETYNAAVGELVLPDRIGVFLNDGSGRFSASPMGPHVITSSWMSTADLDGDRDTDLAYVDFRGLVTVSLNQTPAPPCPADFNGDARVTSKDLTFFLGRFGQTAEPGSPAQRADFDADGTVGIPDLTYFLGRFGTACP